jgi:uncharacterized protein (DUF934 family)
MIRGGCVQRDATRLFAPDKAESSFAPLPPDEPDWAVPLVVWVAHEAALRARRHPVGIQLLPDDDMSSLAGDRIDPAGIAFIAIHFPVYTDGRGFSLAQLLRHTHGWTGEMRAVGDVLIDTVHYLARCGFDSFVLKEGHDPALALAALGTFSASYQRAYPGAPGHEPPSLVTSQFGS